jgi:drug/metabolite transporter (DMT)-like permease
VGDALMAIGIFTWTAYWLFSKKARESATALEYMATVMLVAAVTMTFIAPITHSSLQWPVLADWVRLSAVALFAGAVGHSLLAWSHRHVEAWLGAIILESGPVMATALAWVILGETIGWVTATGGIVVLSGVTVLVVRSGRRNPEEFDEAEASTPST